MAHVLQMLPMLEGQEMAYVQSIIKDMSEPAAQQFAIIYSSRRKDPQIILLTTLLGFVFLAGIQRLITDQIGMGLLYLFTGGLCMIGTIIDLINFKDIAFEYNVRVAQQTAMAVRSMNL